MNKRWYISVLVVLFAFLSGIVTQEHISKPNQEIVLQFASNTVSSEDADDTISTIKDQLKSVGVANIQVTEYDNGKLKITYHSTAEVSDIKKILVDNETIALDNDNSNDLPSEESTSHFNLDVYEIQTAYDADLDIQGTSSSNPKGDQDRIVQTNPFADLKSNLLNYLKNQVNTTYKFYTHNRIVLNHISYKIPEVRAGPNPNRILLCS